MNKRGIYKLASIALIWQFLKLLPPTLMSWVHTETIMSYISFCEDMYIPSQTFFINK